MTTRRSLFIALGLASLGAPLASIAQPARTVVHRIGYLGALSPAEHKAQVEQFRAGLHELGYVEGKNLAIEFRWAEGNNTRLPGLAAELVRLKVDLIVTHSNPGVRAAKEATATIPIVIAQMGDPVAWGFVASLARPGGNITGMSFFNPELAVKRLDVLKEAFPRLRRVGALVHPDNLGTVSAQQEAAASLKLELELFRVRGPDEMAAAFEAMSKQRVEAVTILEAPMLIANVEAVARFAASHRIPSIGFREVAESGGLIGYGVNFPAMWRRAPVFVDKILKGARPGELPIERATKFDLIVNIKAARALGVAIPQSILVRADRVIE